MEEAEKERQTAARARIEAERRRLKAQYGSLYMGVVKTLARHDPIRLTRNGAPEDEYEGEAREILTHLQEVQSISELRRLIHQVFVQSFNYGCSPHQDPDRDAPKYLDDFAGDESTYGEVAQEVWAAWQRHLTLNK